MSCKHLFVFQKLFLPHCIVVVSNIVYSIIGAIVFEWRTGLTSIGVIPLTIISQGFQLGFVQGMHESKGKYYKESGHIIKESVMNIRTILSLDPSYV